MFQNGIVIELALPLKSYTYAHLETLFLDTYVAIQNVLEQQS